MAPESVNIPIGWILGTFGGLGTVIATLAGTMWATLKARLEAQDKIIQNLQADVARMSKGCGQAGCSWKWRE